MPSYSSQQFLFQRIKELVQPDASLVDAVADILHVSSDSAYRRLRCETPLVLDEAKELCQHFKISLDQILNIERGSTLFENVRIDLRQYNYEKYISDLIRKVNYVGSFRQKEIIYLTKDMPLFHDFYFKPLIAFRYFFWMKTILQHPGFQNRKFEMDCIPVETENMCRELAICYHQIPSNEIWNTESINSAILQIEFYRDSGYFSSVDDIRVVYKSLEETIIHLKSQVEHGVKFMPGENPDTKKSNFKFFYNRIILGDNTVLIDTDQGKTVYLNYDVLNYMSTRDQKFCDDTFLDMQNMMKKSTLISHTSEKQRNIFFSIILNKIKDRQINL